MATQKLQLLKEIPSLFINKFGICSFQNQFGKGYHITTPKNFYISTRKLSIYRRYNTLYMQNKQMLVNLQVKAGERTGTVLITVFN